VLRSGILGAMIPVASAMLALTGALATACFVKVFGVIFLGRPRSSDLQEAHDPSFGMQFGQIVLALACLAFGIFPTWTVRAINAIPEGLLGQGLSGGAADGWLWLTPVSPQTASYGALAVFFGIAVSWLIVFILLHPPRRNNRIRVAPAWDCGFGPLTPRMQYTATSFAMPIRRIFAVVWQIFEKVEPAREGKGPRYLLHISDRLWLTIYVPIGKILLRLAERTSRIQGGNLRVYLCYSFFTLLFLLWVIV
jgi:NADH:ubiquinone oxidoreductase subunit 5 (subunit L)/multisubunit Na+/H+ antiporter MnhA subunit